MHAVSENCFAMIPDFNRQRRFSGYLQPGRLPSPRKLSLTRRLGYFRRKSRERYNPPIRTDADSRIIAVNPVGSFFFLPFKPQGPMLVFLYRLLARLPLNWLQTLGRLLGRAVYALPGRYRDRLRANAAQAGYADPAFARAAAAEAGAGMLELAWVWMRTPQALARVSCDDLSLVTEALANGRPVIFLTPHLGCFDIAARYVARLAPITVLYRPPRQRIVAELVESSRAASRVLTAPATLPGVRQLVRALRSGEQVGILPDQVPGQGEGEWAPFFGRPAYTVTLPARLAKQADALVMVACCQRRPAGRGWHLRVCAVDAPVPDAPEAQAAWVNAAMEPMIRLSPEQYLWSYNRYKNP